MKLGLFKVGLLVAICAILCACDTLSSTNNNAGGSVYRETELAARPDRIKLLTDELRLEWADP